jgi:hypothetical protein
METMEAGATALQKRGRGGVQAEKRLVPRRENAGTYAVQWNLSQNDIPAFLVALENGLFRNGSIVNSAGRTQVKDENVLRILPPSQ